MESDERSIEFVANPTQRLFIESRADADLFSCRMGEGKSAALCWAIWFHCRENPGARWAVIRDSWENLRDTTLQEFFKWFPPGVLGLWYETRKQFIWKMGEMHGSVTFMGMDDPKDAAKLQSRELAGFAIDEPAPAAESGGVSEDIFDIAMTRRRQPGMHWYAAKLAENNPDELHWTYRRFVDPGTPGYVCWQTDRPENERNLPENYYERMKRDLAHRPDLLRRFAEGRFGFQQKGRAVTPEWTDGLHLAESLDPVEGVPLTLCWDFGLNPTCVVTQVTPLGHWLVLESEVGQEIGTFELVEQVVKPKLASRFEGFTWQHVGDPAGQQREQASAQQSAVKVIQKELGGGWRSGPTRLDERVEPLRNVLRQQRNGTGLVRVDKKRASHVYMALRGGWHYHVHRTGVVSPQPVKDEHSHPGDATAYGAARLFPLGRLQKRRHQPLAPRSASFFRRGGLGFEKPGLRLPKDGEGPRKEHRGGRL